MPPLFWMGLGGVGLGLVLGFLAGARSRDTSAFAGALTGLYLGVMFSFPLLAIGLSTS